MTDTKPIQSAKPRSLRENLREKGYLPTAKELWSFLVERLFEIRLTETASTMTLATILGIVPLLAITLAVFAAFPAFSGEREALENLILTSFIPEQYSEVILSHLREFSYHAAGLTTFGIVGLLLTGLLLIHKLFVTINRIFHIRHLKSLPQRVLLYWALVTVGPISMAVSVSFTGHIAALTLEGTDPGISRFFYSVGIMLLQTIAYAAVYVYVPNCIVRFRDALISGFVVSLASLVVKRLFAHYVAVGTFSSIYGAFAAIPVFFLWIYVAWYLFFAGAAMTAVLPQLLVGRAQDHFKAGNSFYTALAFIECFLKEKRKTGVAILTVTDLSERTDTVNQEVRAVLDLLADINYVKPIDDGKTEESWALLADPATATILPVFKAFVLDDTNRLVTDTTSIEVFNGKVMNSLALNTPLMEVFSQK